MGSFLGSDGQSETSREAEPKTETPQPEPRGKARLAVPNFVLARQVNTTFMNSDITSRRRYCGG